MADKHAHAHEHHASAAETLPVTSLLHAGYSHATLRAWQTERVLARHMLVYPVFVNDKVDTIDPIVAMPGQARVSVDRLAELLAPLVAKGLPAVLLFGVPESITKASVRRRPRRRRRRPGSAGPDP